MSECQENLIFRERIVAAWSPLLDLNPAHLFNFELVCVKKKRRNIATLFHDDAISAASTGLVRRIWLSLSFSLSQHDV